MQTLLISSGGARLSNKKIIEGINENLKHKIDLEIKGMTFTKNFRSPTAEEWYIFLPSYKDPVTGGAPGKAIIHYNLYDLSLIHI